MFNLKILQRRKLFYILPLILLGSFAWAHQPSAGQGRLSVGPFTSRFMDSPSPIKTPTFIGAGVIGELDFSDYSGIEIAIFYFESQFAVDHGGYWLVERAHRIYIPIGYRYWFSKYVSLATSFYATYRIGKWEDVYRSPGLTSEIVTSAQDIAEYGFDFSVQTDLFTNDKFALILDSRFLLPTTDKPDENSRAYMFFLGLKYRVH